MFNIFMWFAHEWIFIVICLYTKDYDTTTENVFTFLSPLSMISYRQNYDKKYKSVNSDN